MSAIFLIFFIRLTSHSKIVIDMENMKRATDEKLLQIAQ